MTVTLTDDIQSISDKALRSYVGQFTVRPPKQPDPIEVVSCSPLDETVTLDDRPTIQVQFNTMLNPFTVTEDTVLIMGSHSGTIAPSFPNVLMGGDELTIQLERALIAGERVSIQLGGGLASAEGAILPTTRLAYTVATEAGTEFPTEIVSGSLPNLDGHVLLIDCDRDGRDEWVMIDRSGRVEAQELIVDTPSTIEVQQLGESVIDAVTGDFDGDGRMDIVCLGASEIEIYVLLGSSSGSRILDVAFTATLTHAASGLAAAPIDFDAIDDLLLVPSDSNTETVVAFGASQTPFSTSVESDLAITSPAVLADFDRDGAIDIVHADPFGGVGLARGIGEGRFEESISISLVDANELTVANIDGDSLPDVVVHGNGSVRGLVLLSDGDGTFTTLDLPLESAVQGSAIVDFDGDGGIDAIGPRAGSTNAIVWSGLLSESGAIAFVEEPSRIAFGDVDGDGVIDLGALSITGRWDIFQSDPVTPAVSDLVFASDITAAAGSTNEPFDVVADNADPIDGFTIALAYDAALVTLERLSTIGSDSEGVGVELEMPNLDPVNGTAIVAVIFDFLPPFDGQQLAAGTDHRLLTGDISITPGTTAKVRVTIEERAPITLLMPFLKSLSKG